MPIHELHYLESVMALFVTDGLYCQAPKHDFLEVEQVMFVAHIQHS